MSLVERLIVSSSAYSTVEPEQVRVAESRLEELRTGAAKGVRVEHALHRAREILTHLEAK